MVPHLSDCAPSPSFPLLSFRTSLIVEGSPNVEGSPVLLYIRYSILPLSVLLRKNPLYFSLSVLLRISPLFFSLSVLLRKNPLCVQPAVPFLSDPPSELRHIVSSISPVM